MEIRQLKIEDLPITPVDPQGQAPLYQQIMLDLKRMIQSGAIPTGAMLPPEVEIGRAYNVARQTVRMAISRMVDENLVERTPGRGTFVKLQSHRMKFYLDRSFTQQIKDMGYTPRSEVISQSAGTVDDASPEALRGYMGLECLHLIRLRYGDGEPFSLQSTTILTDLCPDLDRHNFGQESLYEVLARDYRLAIRRIHHVIRAVAADDYLADVLRVPPGSPLLRVHTTAFLEDRRVIETTESHYRADKYEFSTTHMVQGQGGALSVYGLQSSGQEKPEPANAALAYVDRAQAIVERIRATQMEAIERAADLCANTIAGDGLVHMFGSGHSRMFVEEIFPRHGSFPGFHPIVELSLTYHNAVVGANGQRQAMFLEHVEGFGQVILRNFVFAPPDSFLIFSNSGVNEVVVDVALEAKRQQMPIIAIVSLDHCQATPAAHSSGKKLIDLADVVIDNCTPAGDAMVQIEGLEDRVGPGSTIGAATVANAVKCRVAEKLARMGRPPIVLTSSYFIGTDASKKRFDECYDDYRARVQRVYGKCE